MHRDIVMFETIGKFNKINNYSNSSKCTKNCHFERMKNKLRGLLNVSNKFLCYYIYSVTNLLLKILFKKIIRYVKITETPTRVFVQFWPFYNFDFLEFQSNIELSSFHKSVLNSSTFNVNSLLPFFSILFVTQTIGFL